MSAHDEGLDWVAAAGHNEEVLYAVDGPLGRVRLNRPRAINALTPAMTRSLLAQLTAWKRDPSVAAVFIDGASERGLCAGGDVRGLREHVRARRFDDVRAFWEGEYAVNALIASYPKPFVAWMDGVVMGGGVGVSSHGSMGVVTERTKLAMPETIIGFFPDVGGLYFLSHAPGEIGTHVALTGVPVGGADALALDMADAMVPSGAKEGVLEVLRAEPDAGATRLVEAVGQQAGQSWLEDNRPWIDACYVGDDAAQILARLHERPEPEAQEAAEQIAARSPFSVTVTLEALRRAASMDVEQVLAQDLLLGETFARHPDFSEGVRALLVDKDKSPVWQHTDVADVPREQVLAAFG